jgi:dTDP-glucose 4,6-dehydratase
VLQRGQIGEVYNIGGQNERANIDVVKTILELLEKPLSLIQYVADRPGHDLRYAINANKIREQLGWQPEVSFEAGLETTIKWYQQNQSWWMNILSGEYRGA